ncbi:MAG: pyruvate kinase [Ignavibacteria bacterium]|nr:pyruvate kinase [Ignavibacteria bacterium]MBT8380810.1 pyruvate kinase [Ignavibacteria bacterium]MBT8392761.1 pyruvate kinase [Ignavibacteria bacterium]NNJ54322.1 pyruvate kinase [Ignavibacteriaceae bacterium]NNL22044.1 pyruvate kinase [Ignavibacteriaceae bacterium]
MREYTKTKILATLGPQTASTEKIKELVTAGVNAVRLNMSHGDHDFYTSVFENIHSVRRELNLPLAVLADLQGPKIRIGELKKPEIRIDAGNKIEITVDDILGDDKFISTSYKTLAEEAEIGELILINDGLIRLRIIEKKKDSVTCEIENGGIISSRKGMNLPGMKLSTPSLTEKDYADLEFLIDKKIDFIALSFIRKSDDIIQLKKWLKENAINVPVIAKIEKKEAYTNFDSILKESDGIMIARGDLGVELSLAEVPVIQKEIIKQCNETGTLVITATQMLESMIDCKIPTRAEAADVANAVWDGTDVVMLSGETSIGKFPVETVKMMHEIVLNAERHFFVNDNIKFHVPETLEENLFDSVLKGITQVAEQIKASAIVVFTFKGRAARGLAKYRPAAKIVALSDSFDTMNKLCLRWGVASLFTNKIDKQNAAINEAKELILNNRLVNKGDLVIFLSRAPFSEKGRKDWLHIDLI